MDLVHLDRVTDAAHCLRLREAQHVEAFLEDFERRFPQVFIAVYLGVLPQSFSVAELSFWLLNHAAFNHADAGKLNEHAAVLIIDPSAKAVGLNVGYSLEPFFPVKQLNKIVQAMRTPLWHGEYVGAIELAVRRVEKCLKRVACRAPAQKPIAPPPSAEAFMNGSGLRALRRSEGASIVEKDWKNASRPGQEEEIF